MLDTKKKRALGILAALCASWLGGSASCGSLTTKPTCVVACEMLCSAITPDRQAGVPSVDAAFNGVCAEGVADDNP